jgi:hypothetical protein
MQVSIQGGADHLGMKPGGSRDKHCIQRLLGKQLAKVGIGFDVGVLTQDAKKIFRRVANRDELNIGVSIYDGAMG